jgi:hypothetical protein
MLVMSRPRAQAIIAKWRRSAVYPARIRAVSLARDVPARPFSSLSQHLQLNSGTCRYRRRQTDHHGASPSRRSNEAAQLTLRATRYHRNPAVHSLRSNFASGSRSGRFFCDPVEPNASRRALSAGPVEAEEKQANFAAPVYCRGGFLLRTARHRTGTYLPVMRSSITSVPRRIIRVQQLAPVSAGAILFIARTFRLMIQNSSAPEPNLRNGPKLSDRRRKYARIEIVSLP